MTPKASPALQPKKELSSPKLKAETLADSGRSNIPSKMRETVRNKIKAVLEGASLTCRTG